MATCHLLFTEPEFELTLNRDEAVAVREALYPVDDEVLNEIYNELTLVTDHLMGSLSHITLKLTTEQAALIREALEDDESEHTDEPFWALQIALQKAWGSR